MLNKPYPIPSETPAPRTRAQGIARRFQVLVANVYLQLQNLKGRLTLAVLTIALAVGLILLISNLRQVALSDLVRDVFAVAEQPVYIGFLSNLGILLWGSSATIWAMCVFALRNTARRAHLASLCRWSLALSLVLLIDDALMLHESILPRWFGISERMVISGIGLFGIAYLIRCGALIVRKTAYVPAFLAGGFLAVSVLSDQVLTYSELQTVVEDSLKFAGIVFWLTYALTVFEQLWQAREAPQMP